VIPAAIDPDAARADAREILSDRRFQSDPAPRPLRGPLRWLGERLNDIGSFLADVFRSVPWPFWVVLALAFLGALVWWFARRIERRGAGGRGVRSGHLARPAVEDPAALEREADDAEARGDFEHAVRLRFRAGLLRLGARGVIEYRPSLTTSEVRQMLGSRTFDELAATFEQVAYGGRHASAPDAGHARVTWPRVLEEQRRR
jgi:hypothetical protein